MINPFRVSAFRYVDLMGTLTNVPTLKLMVFRKFRAQMLQIKEAGTTQIRMMEEIRITSWYGKYPIIYMVLYIPGGAGFLPSTVWQVFVLMNMFSGDCLKPGWIFMKHQQDSTEVCGCGTCSPLAQIKDFGFGDLIPLNFSISSPKFVPSTWPAPGHFSPMDAHLSHSPKQLPTMTTLAQLSQRQLYTVA